MGLIGLTVRLIGLTVRLIGLTVRLIGLAVRLIGLLGGLVRTRLFVCTRARPTRTLLRRAPCRIRRDSRVRLVVRRVGATILWTDRFGRSAPAWGCRCRSTRTPCERCAVRARASPPANATPLVPTNSAPTPIATSLSRRRPPCRRPAQARTARRGNGSAGVIARIVVRSRAHRGERLRARSEEPGDPGVAGRGVVGRHRPREESIRGRDRAGGSASHPLDRADPVIPLRPRGIRSAPGSSALGAGARGSPPDAYRGSSPRRRRRGHR